MLRKFKKAIAICVTITLLLLSTSSVLASSSQAERENPNPYNIKTEEELTEELRISFLEVYSSEFKESDYPGMIITYAEDGVPIVYDPRQSARRTKYFKNGFYSDSSCNDLLFYVLKDYEVEVIDYTFSNYIAKVKYADSTGYMKKSQLYV